ncbi:MAG: hypothetical protein GXY74_04805 [Phycisphaerae bacterium]|nr:hypothetical protein [Phycisphaerae bacterium]
MQTDARAPRRQGRSRLALVLVLTALGVAGWGSYLLWFRPAPEARGRIDDPHAGKGSSSSVDGPSGGPRAATGPQAAPPPPARREPATLDTLYARAGDAVRAGRPIVVTVHVCLCDNRQGIAPVSASLGDGDTPRTNLYWGAMFGLKTFFKQSRAWELLIESQRRDGDPDGMLEQAVFRHRVPAASRWPGVPAAQQVEMLLVARAWRGMPMENALGAFAADALGSAAWTVALPDGRTIDAGGAGHVVGFVGHNSLMNAAVRETNLFAAVNSPVASPPVGWFVLACKSDAYFTPHLARPHAVRLLATRQFMAPEAYTLAALLEAFAERQSAATLRDRAARAYARYQKITQAAALGVFVN